MESFDIVLIVFFVFFTIWLSVITYKLYDYFSRTWKIKCLICNSKEEMQNIYHCRTVKSHKFHKVCFEKEYKCPACTGAGAGAGINAV